jgi:hypothetical protein
MVAMMKKFTLLKVLAVCLTAAASLSTVAISAGPAAAQSRPLDGPRAAGVIGERFDGYTVLRDQSAPADIRQLVETTNAERRDVYEKRAKATNAPVEEVGKVYAEQIMQQAPDGTWFLGPDGNWTQKQ